MLNTLKQLWQILTPLDKRMLSLVLALVMIMALIEFSWDYAATAWYGYTLYEFHHFTNMSALFYTGSVMIFLMGLISEQITALMYKDAK